MTTLLHYQSKKIVLPNPMSKNEAQRIVEAWRERNPQVVALWSKIQSSSIPAPTLPTEQESKKNHE